MAVRESRKIGKQNYSDIGKKEIINIKRGSRLEQKIKIILLFIFLFHIFAPQNSILKQEIVYTLKTNKRLSENRCSKRVLSVRIDFFILLEHLLQDYPL